MGRVSCAWERVLEKTLLRGSSGSASYLVTVCHVLSCGKVPPFSAKQKHSEFPLRPQKRVRVSLLWLHLKQQLTQQPTACGSRGLQKPCIWALGAGPAEVWWKCGMFKACRERGGDMDNILYALMALSATATKQLNRGLDRLYSQIQRSLCPQPLPTYTSCSKEWSQLSTWHKASQEAGKFRKSMFYYKTLSLCNLKCWEECLPPTCTTGQSLHPQKYSHAWKKPQAAAGNLEGRCRETPLPASVPDTML